MSDLPFNYRFCVQWAKSQPGPVLDFGCGGGAIVRAGLANDIDIYGADVFFAASPEYEEQAGDLLGNRIRRIDDGRLPFPDAFFGSIVSNQVIEHVQELDVALRELRRVLRPGGKVLALFPTLETVRENHCGVLFAHWLVGTPLFEPWMKAARALGLTAPTKKASVEWVQGFRRYLNEFCHYRTQGSLRRQFAAAGLPIHHIEDEYVRARWGHPILPGPLFRILGGVVIQAG